MTDGYEDQFGGKKGKKFKVACPTTYFSTIKFLNGTIIRLTLSFDVISHLRNHIELYGKDQCSHFTVCQYINY